MVMGLTMTNTLIQLVASNYGKTADLADLPLRTTLYSLLLILTIFRFYHGNMRHLDCVYCANGSTARNLRSASHGGLGVDFIVILSQSVLFAVMSFYASRPEELLILFVVLLASDVIWTLIDQQPSEDRTEFTHQRRWLLNNVGALVAMLAIFAISRGGEHSNLLIYGGAAAMFVNAIFDFKISWEFYFPTIALAGEESREQ